MAATGSALPLRFRSKRWPRVYEVWESVHDLQRFAVRLEAAFAAHQVSPSPPLVSELLEIEAPAGVAS